LAVTRGLRRDDALRAMTVAPAELFGVAQRLGTLEPGKIANLVVTDGDVFDEKGKVLETWVEGRRYIVQPSPEVEVRGNWVATLGGNGHRAVSGGKAEANEIA